MKTRVYNPPPGNPNRNMTEVTIIPLGKPVVLGEEFVLTDEQDAKLGDDERFPYVTDAPKQDVTPAKPVVATPVPQSSAP